MFLQPTDVCISTAVPTAVLGIYANQADDVVGLSQLRRDTGFRYFVLPNFMLECFYMIINQILCLNCVHNCQVKHITLNKILNFLGHLLRYTAMSKLHALRFVSAFCCLLRVDSLFFRWKQYKNTSENTYIHYMKHKNDISSQYTNTQNTKKKTPRMQTDQNSLDGISFQRSQLSPAERKHASVKLKNKTETDHIRYKFQLTVAVLSVLSVLGNFCWVSTVLASSISIQLASLCQSLLLIKCCNTWPITMLQRCSHVKFRP